MNEIKTNISVVIIFFMSGTRSIINIVYTIKSNLNIGSIVWIC
jgi:hypothetical protein